LSKRYLQVAHGFQSALSGSRFNQAPGFAGGCVTNTSKSGDVWDVKRKREFRLLGLK
jgi:hypothetical protein